MIDDDYWCLACKDVGCTECEDSAIPSDSFGVGQQNYPEDEPWYPEVKSEE